MIGKCLDSTNKHLSGRYVLKCFKHTSALREVLKQALDFNVLRAITLLLING